MRIYYVLTLFLLLTGCHEHTASVRTETYSGDTAKNAIKKGSTLKSDNKPQKGTSVLIGDSIYYTGSDVCMLHGKLIQKLFYGPPGFSADEESKKSDVHWTFFLIVLDKPISILSEHTIENGDTIVKLDTVQINDQRGNVDLLAQLNKQTTIKGILEDQIAPSQWTLVTLEYQAVIR